MWRLQWSIPDKGEIDEAKPPASLLQCGSNRCMWSDWRQNGKASYVPRFRRLPAGRRRIAPGIVDLIAGHVQLSFPSIPVVIQHVRGGKLRMIGQCGETRSPSMPDVPTMQESGLPGFIVSSGFSFLGPAGIPRPVVEKLNSALVKSLQDPANRKELLNRGAVPVGNTPEQHAAYIKAEIEKWRKVAQGAGIKPE